MKSIAQYKEPKLREILVGIGRQKNSVRSNHTIEKKAYLVKAIAIIGLYIGRH